MEQELPLVSIVTPSYNKGEFIEETIPFHRVYGAQRFPMLLEGYRVVKEIVLNFKAEAGLWDPLWNVYALGCFALRRL